MFIIARAPSGQASQAFRLEAGAVKMMDPRGGTDLCLDAGYAVPHNPPMVLKPCQAGKASQR